MYIYYNIQYIHSHIYTHIYTHIICTGERVLYFTRKRLQMSKPQDNVHIIYYETNDPKCKYLMTLENNYIGFFNNVFYVEASKTSEDSLMILKSANTSEQKNRTGPSKIV